PAAMTRARGEPASSARREPSREGSGTLPGFLRQLMRTRIAAALIAIACIAGAAGTARAATLNPFRKAAADTSGAGRSLDPFRVAQALPATPPEDEKPAPAKAAPAKTAPAQAPTARACQRDEDCGEGNICQANVCKAIEL